jgi:hypothetical protein
MFELSIKRCRSIIIMIVLMLLSTIQLAYGHARAGKHIGDFSPLTIRVVNNTGLDLPLPYTYYFNIPCDPQYQDMSYALNSPGPYPNILENVDGKPVYNYYDPDDKDPNSPGAIQNVVHASSVSGYTTSLANGQSVYISAFFPSGKADGQGNVAYSSQGPQCVVGYISIGGYLLGATVDTNGVLRKQETTDNVIYSPGMPIDISPSTNNQTDNQPVSTVFSNSKFMIIGGPNVNPLVSSGCSEAWPYNESANHCGNINERRYVYFADSRANGTITSNGKYEFFDAFVLGNAPADNSSPPVTYQLDIVKKNNKYIDYTRIYCPDRSGPDNDGLYLCPGVIGTFTINAISSNQGPTSANTAT